MQLMQRFMRLVCVWGGGGGEGGGGVTHVRENYGVDALYVEEVGYPARI